MKINRKTFGRKKVREVAAIRKTTRAIHDRREIPDILAHFIRQGKPGRVEQFLLDRGIVPCVAREWGNEPARRQHAAAFRLKKITTKALSAFGKRGDFGRRIIKTIHKYGREIVFHATKGYRTYRIAAEAAE